MVRAKFTVVDLIRHSWMPETARQVILEPRYDESIPEDTRFSQYTPAGRIEMHLDSPVALAQFAIGSVHYVDFTPIPA